MPSDQQTTPWLYETSTNEKPLAPGWYPTLHGWDGSEGWFPDGHYWNGTAWEGDTASAVIGFIQARCATKEEANDRAYEHDCDA